MHLRAESCSLYRMSRLREIRIEAGVPVSELAAAIGVSGSAVRRWEAKTNPARPRVEHARAITDFLDSIGGLPPETGVIDLFPELLS